MLGSNPRANTASMLHTTCVCACSHASARNVDARVCVCVFSFLCFFLFTIRSSTHGVQHKTAHPL